MTKFLTRSSSLLIPTTIQYSWAFISQLIYACYYWSPHGKFLCGLSFDMNSFEHLPWWLCAPNSAVHKSAVELDSTAGLLHHGARVCSAYVSWQKLLRKKYFKAFVVTWIRVITEEEELTPFGSLAGRAEHCGRCNFRAAFSRRGVLPWDSLPMGSIQFRVFSAAS